MTKFTIIRRVLSVVSVAVAVFAFSGIFCATQIGNALIDNEVAGLGLDMITLSPVNPSNAVPEGTLKKISAVDGVYDIYPIVVSVCPAKINDLKCDSYIWGVGKENSSMIKTNTVKGREISDEDVAYRRMVCAVTTDMAEKSYGGEEIIGKTAVINLGGLNWDFLIVGTVEAASDLLNAVAGQSIDNVVLIPHSTYNMLIADNAVLSASIRISSNDTKRIVSEIDDIVSEDYVLSELSAQKNTIDQIILFINTTLIGIALISLFVAAIGIVSENWSAVNESARDIGIKLSIGARSCDIVGDVVKKSVVITLAGTLVGLLFTFVAVQIVLNYISRYVAINYIFMLPVILGGVIIGVLCSIVPALSAVKISPIEIIKG